MSESKFLEQKFLLCVVAFATFTALRIFDLLDQGGYVALAMFALGGYLGANLMQKPVARDAGPS